MTDIVKEEASGQVFIPESLNDTDKEYLLEVSGQITTTIQRAAVRVGFYLLEVKERFRNDGQFGGSNGWFGKWYKSLGFTQNSVLPCINAAQLVQAHPDLAASVELLSNAVLTEMSQPSSRGGTSSRLQRLVLERVTETGDVSREVIRRLKAPPQAKLEALQEFSELAQARLDARREALDGYSGYRDHTEPEYSKLISDVTHAENSLAATKVNIEKLLNAPDPVVEEPKEEPTPTPPEPVVIDPNPALEQELQELQQEKERILQEYEALKSQASPAEALVKENESLKRKNERYLHDVVKLQDKITLMENPMHVTPLNFKLKLSILVHHATEFGEHAVGFEHARGISRDAWEVDNAKRAIIQAWDAWANYAPMDMIDAFNASLQTRIHRANCAEEASAQIVNI